jgi:hypothetical protein
MSAARSTSSAARFAKTATSRRTPAPAPESDTPATPPSIGRTAQRTKPVRTTVDLPPTKHRRLVRIADQLAEDLDLREVPRVWVWLALLAELDADSELYARVRERIKTEQAELT